MALVVAVGFRFGLDVPEVQIEALRVAVPLFIMVCIFIYPIAGLYNRNWRLASILDMVAVPKAVSLASLVFVSLMFLMTRLDSVPRSVVALEVLILIPLLVAVRLSFRVEELRTVASALKRAKGNHKQLVPVLLVGAGNASDLYLRALQRDSNCPYWPVGLIDDDPRQRDTILRGVPVLGSFNEFNSVLLGLELQGQRPRHIIFTEPLSGYGGQRAEDLIGRAEALGIAISRLPPLTELRSRANDRKFELRPIELTDLLERPQTVLDRAALRRLISDRRILVTGAGGSIGSELALQVAAFDPAELVLIEHSELNLYAIDLELSEKFSSVPRAIHLCNIRDAARLGAIFDRHRPEIVFHAAALKHVPMVELNPGEGVLTNVLGTRNVADAAARVGVLAMVQISTDKAVNSTSVMGATKRLAELYCQALDLDEARTSGSSRFMTVRFGNVLGSSGSLVPLFHRQLSRGGPLTVTHPEMERFFMTIREAVELTLQASAYGLEQRLGQGEVFVLDMGAPIKVLEIAKRMIRLAGYVPDRDIKIEMIGLRPGEKLFEELFDKAELRVESPVPGVLGAIPSPVPLETLKDCFGRLHDHARRGDMRKLLAVVSEILPHYQPTDVASAMDIPHSDSSMDQDAAA